MSDTASERPDTSDMAAVHRVFRTSLATVPDLVDSSAGDDGRRAMIANYFDNLIYFLEAHHDGEEAIIFPRLIERAPAHRAVVDTAESQHAAVHELIGGARDSVALWGQKGDAAGPEVVSSLGALNNALCAHLDEEEAVIVPLAGEHLTAEEWGMLPGHALGGFQGDKVWLIMGLVHESFNQTQRDAMMSHMPPPALQMWETMGEASFTELIAQVRQTA